MQRINSLLTMAASVAIFLIMTGGCAFALSFMRQERSDIAQMKRGLESEHMKLRRENEYWVAQVARNMTPQILKLKAEQKHLKLPKQDEVVFAYKVENASSDRLIISFHSPDKKRTLRTAKK